MTETPPGATRRPYNASRRRTAFAALPEQEDWRPGEGQHQAAWDPS